MPRETVSTATLDSGAKAARSIRRPGVMEGLCRPRPSRSHRGYTWAALTMGFLVLLGGSLRGT